MTGFTQHRLAFGREMHPFVDLPRPLPEPPLEVRTFAAELAENLEWSYKVAREIIWHRHKRAKSRYNERVVKRAYQPGCLVRMLLHACNCNVPSRLDTQYSVLCEVMQVSGALLTRRELKTQRIFTANYDAIRRSTMTRPAAPQVTVSRVAPLPQYRALHLYFLTKRCPAEAKQIFNQCCTQRPIHLLDSTLLPTARTRMLSQSNQQVRQPATHRRSAPTLPKSRDASPRPPVGSPAVLPPHPLYKKRTRRNARRNNHAFARQALVPVAQSTPAPQVPSRVDLQVNSAPSPITHANAPELRSRVSPGESVQASRAHPRRSKPVSPQQHLTLVCKKPRVAMQIVDANVDSQFNATAYCGYSAPASAARNRRRPAQQQLQVDTAPADLVCPPTHPQASR